MAGSGLKHRQVIHVKTRNRKSVDIWLTTLATAGCRVEQFADSKGFLKELLT